MNKKLIFIIILIIYLIIVFGTEVLYRNKLYEISFEYIENIKQKGFSIFSIFLVNDILIFYADNRNVSGNVFLSYKYIIRIYINSINFNFYYVHIEIIIFSTKTILGYLFKEGK